MNSMSPKQAGTLLVLSTLACGSAWAQSSPYYIGAALALTRDSNIYAQKDAVSDTITTATLLAGIDQPIGRQRLNLSASVRDNRFAEDSSQNHYAYNLNGRIDWETVDRLSGTVRASADQTRLLQDYVSNADEARERVLANSRSLGGTVRLGVVTRMTVEASLNTRQQEYKRENDPTTDQPRNDNRDYHFTDGGLSLRYGTSPDLTFGVGLRLGDGRYTNTDIDFKRRDIDLLTTWRASGASTINARLSASKLDYKPADIGDFSGLTGNVVWDWAATGKVKLVSRIFRDNSDTAGQGFDPVNPAAGQTDTSQVSTGVSVTADYAFSSKISFTASASATRHTIEDIFSANQQPDQRQSGRDRLAQFSVGARWTPLRVMTVGCDLSQTRRTTPDVFLNGDGSARNEAFDRTSIGCSVQAMLQ